jgi:hypothetical protein
MEGFKSKVLIIGVFLLFVLLADRFIGMLLENLYRTTNNITISKIRYTLNETNEDILIFGSSRAQHHYIPDTISKVTGHTVYNCGLGGQGIVFSYIQISETLKRYKPLIIMLDFSNMPLGSNVDPKLKILGHYYHNNDLIRSILNNGSRFEKFKYVFSIYPYNGLLYNLLLGLIYSPDVSFKGYIPISGSIDTNLIIGEDSGKIQGIDAKQMSYLQEITNICHKHKVDFWILVSPIYRKTKNDSKIIQDLKIFTEQQRVHFLDFSQTTYFSNHLLFKDNLHLNSNGTNIYSRIVGDSILTSMK